ncbi:MAG: CHAT domain-containing protein [Coleofasciculus sp. S288]|nr:CHAT domain-containing protein [Coleofasciculus sp. S288]
MELFELYLSPIDATRFKVIVTQSPAGEGETESSLPFCDDSQDRRITLIKTLESASFRSESFVGEGEQEWMVTAEILAADRTTFHPDYPAKIGKELYRALFPPGSKVERALHSSLRQAEEKNTQLLVQLKLEADAVQRSRLADYPWELLHDGQRFLLHHQLGFSRYIAHDTAPPSLPPVEQVNVLLVSSAAFDSQMGLKRLSKQEQQAIRKGLEKASDAGHISLRELEYPTFNELRTYLTENRGKEAPHVLHFDGHGLFGKRCQQCGAMHKGIKVERCKKEACLAPLPDPQGYLVFEDEEGEADYISAKELGTLLHQTRLSDGTHQTGGVALVVLSACQSGMAVAGESVFNGTAQNLIGHRVPAVVAMQYSVSVEAATKFAEQFYRSLGQKDSLTVAVNQGREAMGAEGNQWYRPVLYLRWRDNQGGQLFSPPKPVARLGIPFQAPPLPTYFVDRPEVSQELKKRLLTSSSSTAGTLVVSAIHGLGAIGKSTLAAALAHDEAVKNHFSDGILWATLGQQPDVLSLLSGWVKALGDYNFQSTSVEATSAHLRTLLDNKAVLLVVDDAWNPKDAQHFQVGNSRCQMLVTTRDGAIADTLRASTYSLDVMKPEQAMELLTKKLGRELQDAERQSAEALAEAVGYLPLALELASAQIADGISWAVLLQDIKQEVARLKTFDRPGARDATDEKDLKTLSLTASLNLSVQRLSEDERQNFIWLGVLPEDVTITQAMTATLWDMDERDAGDTLRYLRSKALLLPGVPLSDGTLTFRLHDLLHDLARNLLTAPGTPKRRGDLPGLGLSLPTAQAKLLEQYRKKTQNQQWHTLPNDGYIHQNLVWHLEQAGWVEEIHKLLEETAESGRNGWYEAQERLGQTASYVQDVSRAWKLADDANPAQTPICRIIGWQCRYALSIASLNSLAKNVPPALLVALVRKKVWTPEQGVAYALQIPDPQQKVEAITQLTKLENYLPAPLEQKILQAALEAARAIQDEYNRVHALSALAEKLPESLLPIALEAARAIQSEYYRAHALSALAPKLPDVLPIALEASRAIQDESRRALALSALAEKLPDVLPIALEAARAIQDESSRADALSALAPKLPESLLPIALEAARAIQDESYRADALRALASYLSQIPEAQLISLWQETLHLLSLRTRQSLLSDLAVLVPVIFALDGQETMAETFRAIQDVARWWR